MKTITSVMDRGTERGKGLMRAVVRAAYGGPEQLVLRELPVPVPASDEVLIHIRAFGLNHAELYMRKGAWGEVVPVGGIECVGEVEHDPSGKLRKGTKVASIMGGMGRTRNGSYAEYSAVLVAHVFPLKTELDWADLAAIPESYAAAWSALFDHLRLNHGETLLIRGGTSTFGQAAINIASELGATVLATTRSREKEPLLKSLGAAATFIEDINLSKTVRERYPEGIDCVLDLVGNKSLLDSARMGQKGTRVCVAGFLGGSDPVPFDVITGLQPGVEISFFASFMYGTKEYPLSKIPMQTIVNRAEAGLYKTKPVKVFRLNELPEAHRLMESNEANGKIVVVV